MLVSLLYALPVHVLFCASQCVVLCLSMCCSVPLNVLTIVLAEVSELSDRNNILCAGFPGHQL